MVEPRPTLPSSRSGSSRQVMIVPVVAEQHVARAAVVLVDGLVDQPHAEQVAVEAAVRSASL